ncbi:MAG: ATP-binding protein [Bacteroidales bacterium]|nr:ATP-binding protein [Bacteroidales bacterium]
MEKIIGREKEIRAIWDVLERQSVVITSLRRMGKTSILKKMTQSPREGWKPILHFVEGARDPQEFVDGLYRQLLERGVSEDRFRRAREYYEKFIGGKDFGQFKMPSFRSHWKMILEKIMEDAVQAQSERILIMIDEFPMMLWNFITTYELADQATELLDTLRKIREMYEDSGKLRFIFCGSIGMNIVLEKLQKKHNYAGEPMNNMIKYPVLEMNPEDALELCRYLFGTDYVFDNKEDVFNHLIQQTNRLPFFIDRLKIQTMISGLETITIQDIDKMIHDLISAPLNNSEFSHLESRIKTYYEEDIRQLSLDILSVLSRHEDYVSEDGVINELKSYSEVDENNAKSALRSLYNDLYLFRKEENGMRTFMFRYPLVRRWWQINLGQPVSRPGRKQHRSQSDK